MTRTILNHTVAASVLATIFLANGANAQDTQTAESGGSGINEIVITARRQEESLQDAALAIDAVDAGSLADQGITNALEITKAVPAISLVNGGGQSTSIFLRGVGNVTNNAYLDAAITTSYDGVTMGRSSGVVGAAFYDLERVEVLKGPQGILYGRNATGGAVNIIPAKPEIGLTGGGVNLGYGNHDAISVDGYVNVTTSDNSALRVSGTHQSHDGYNRDGSDDLDRTGFRAQFLIEPTDMLTVRIGGDWTSVTGNGPGPNYLGHFAQGNFVPSGLDAFEGMNTDAANAYRTTVLGAPGFGFLNPMQGDQSMDFEYWGVNAEITLDTDIGQITFIPAYRESDGYSNFFGPAFNLARFDNASDQFSAELRLAGSSGIVEYVLGAFYFDESVSGLNEFNQEFVLPMQSYTAGTESIAGFGQVTLNLTDQFRLVGGLRYTNDKKEIDGSITNFITFCGPNSPPPVTPPASFGVVGTAGVGCQAPGNLPHFPSFTDPQDALDWLIDGGWVDPASTLTQLPPFYPILTGAGRILRDVSAPADSGSYDRLTWKVGVEYDATPDNLLYATVETGYRAGGFQLASGNTTYDPEFITAYSVGSKNRFLDNRLQLNFEAFWWNYKDQQINYFTVDTSGTLISATKNVGKAEIKGFDIDAIVMPTDTTTLNAKVQYLDTKYDGLLLRTAPPRDNYNCPVTNTGEFTDAHAPILEFDCSGNPLLFSPKWTVNLGAEQVVALDSDFELVGNVNTAYRAKQWGGFNYQPFQLISGRWDTGATLTLRNDAQGWYLQAYVQNIEGGRRITLPQASPIGFATANYSAPRLYGVRLGAEF